jgi:hypothetical protein
MHEAKYEDGTVGSIRCHSIVTNGRITYCTDSDHAFAGQAVEIPEWNGHNPKVLHPLMSHVTGTGTLPVEPALTGQWPFDGFPPAVRLEGATFLVARWINPFRSGVVAQYREAVPANAMHMLVYRNGFYVIGHIDEVSPDPSPGGPGNPVAHALVDAPLATTVVLGALGLSAGLVLGLVFWRS